MTLVSAAPAAPPSPVLRISAFYTSMFLTSGVTTVVGGIWMVDQGLTERQVGIVNAMPVLLMLALNLWVGRLADRADDWRRVIVAGCILAAILPFGLFFASGFTGILVVWTLAMVCHAAIVPVVDAAAMRLSRRAGFEFATVRAWGTVGYLLIIFATGYLVTWFGTWVFLPVLCTVAAARGVLSLGLPRFRAPEAARAPGPGATALLQVMKPWFLLPLVGWSIIFATHLILNAFQGLLWSQQGIPEHLIGALIALGALAETAMFFAFRRFGTRYPARYLILASALVSILRWIAFAFEPGVALLIPLQCLHAITYALGFLGCISFITNWTSEDIAAEAQSFFVVLQQGFAVVAFLGFGWLTGLFGAQAYFASAAFAAVGAAMIWASLRMQAPGEGTPITAPDA